MVKIDGTTIRIDGEEKNKFTEEEFEELIKPNDPDVPNPIAVVQCKEGICRQSLGYILYKDKVYANIGNGVSIVDTTYDDPSTPGENEAEKYVGVKPIDSEEKCDEDHIGLLYNEKDGVCIIEGKGVTFGDDANDYMILKGTIEAGPLANKKNHVHLQRTAKYILTDNFYTGSRLSFFILIII